MQKVLILGESGFLGTAISRRLSAEENMKVYGTFNQTVSKFGVDIERFKLSVEDPDGALNQIERISPECIIACLRGSYVHQLEFCKKLSDQLQGSKTKMIFLSTANVFDANMKRRHDENDTRMSNTEYGRFKIECEKLFMEGLENQCVIIRLPMVFGKKCKRINQLKKAYDKGDKVTLFPNLVINTTTDDMVAEKVAHIILNDYTGVFHFGAKDEISHEKLYMKLAGKLMLDPSIFETDDSETGIFVLNSVRADAFPKTMMLSNDEVIAYISG